MGERSMSLYINKTSQTVLEAVLQSMPHALLLAGPVGIGLKTIAEHYATQTDKVVMTVLPEKDEKIDIEKGIITIAIIRRLYDITKTVAPAGRLIIIDYAERMAAPAQNAFLKLLEEPTEGTSFILLTHTPERLLPTILSRMQAITLRPISDAQSSALLDEVGVIDATLRSQLLFVASGLPAELTRLATNTKAFEIRAEIIRDARTYIQGTPYQRLKVAYEYKDSRQSALVLLEDAMKMIQTSLVRDGNMQYLRLLQSLERTHQRISEQGNVRLQLSAA